MESFPERRPMTRRSFENWMHVIGSATPVKGLEVGVMEMERRSGVVTCKSPLSRLMTATQLPL